MGWGLADWIIDRSGSTGACSVILCVIMPTQHTHTSSYCPSYLEADGGVDGVRARHHLYQPCQGILFWVLVVCWVWREG